MASTGALYLARGQTACAGNINRNILVHIQQISRQLEGRSSTLYRCHGKNVCLMSSLSSNQEKSDQLKMIGQETNIISCARIFSSLAAEDSTPTGVNDMLKHDSQGEIKKHSEMGKKKIPAYSKTPILSLEELKVLACQKPIPLSLSDMFRYASAKSSQRLLNAQFLHKELPARIAQRTVDLLTLPHGLNKTRQVRNIAHKYLNYLHKLKSFPIPKTKEEEARFTNLLSSIVEDRTSIPMAIAAAVSSLKDNRRETLDDHRLQEMEEALYRFFTSRVGLRFLTEHHILSQRTARSENLLQRQGTIGDFPFLGCIQKDCDPVFEVEKVVESVREQCMESFGVAPEIEVLDCTRKKFKNRSFTYVPHHLQYMLAELLKNSCRATVRR